MPTPPIEPSEGFEAITYRLNGAEVIEHDMMALQHQDGQHLARRVGVLGVKAALLGVAGLALGTMAATKIETDANAGPHNAEVILTHDGVAELDLGPFGSLVRPIDWPGGIGARLEVKEVPTGVDSNPFAGEEQLLESYMNFFSSFGEDVDEAGKDMREHIIKLSIFSDLMLFGGYKLLGKRRRSELVESFSQAISSKQAKAVIASTLLVGGISYDGVSGADDDLGVKVDPVFDGTPLEGSYVKGALIERLVNEHAADAANYLKKNDEFYDKVIANMNMTLRQSLPELDNEKVSLGLFYTDLHCNLGMGEVIGALTEQVELAWLASGGDETWSGTSFEEYCIRSMASKLHVKNRLAATGNHDDEQTTGEQLRDHGYTILDREVEDEADMRWLGEADPRRSMFGQHVRHIGDESTGELGRILADIACEDEEGVDILLIHDYRAALEVLRRGCVRLALTGHYHKEHVVAVSSPNGLPTLLINGDSAGGAQHGKPTLGPLETAAALYLIESSKETGMPRRYHTLTIQPDASVTVVSQYVSGLEAISADSLIDWEDSVQ